MGCPPHVRFPSDSDQTADIAGRSGWCHKRTHALQQTVQLFDHRVGANQQRRRHGEAKGVGGLEVDHQLEFGRLFDR